MILAFADWTLFDFVAAFVSLVLELFLSPHIRRGESVC